MSGNQIPRLLGAVLHPRVDWERVWITSRAVGARALVIVTITCEMAISILKSAFTLLTAFASTGLGTLLIYGSVVDLRLSDTALMQHAAANALRRHEPPPSSVLELRDSRLIMLAIAVVFVLFGFERFWVWWRNLCTEWNRYVGK